MKPQYIKSFFFLCTLFLILSSEVQIYGQVDSLCEAFSEFAHEDEDINEVLEQLTLHPIDINTADKDDFEALPFLNSKHIELIINKRPYKNKKQLKVLLGNQMYHLLQPYFVVKKVKRHLRVEQVNRAQYILEKNEGLKNGKYLGSPFAHYFRLKIFYDKKISCGVLAHKDAGEPNITDHMSGYILWQALNGKFKFILGDYQVHAGQGLVLSAPYVLGRSSQASVPLHVRQMRGNAYLSSNESGGFRGAFINYKFYNKLLLAGFYSSKLQDVILDSEKKVIIGMDRSGYHRTRYEIERENRIKETAYGSILELSVWNTGKIGFSYVETQYNPKIKRIEGVEYLRLNFYRFSGEYIRNYSFFYTANYLHLSISGEISAHKNSTLAQQHGFLIFVKPWQVGVKWWHLPINFHTPFGHVFSNNQSFPTAQQGIYIGLTGEIHKFFLLNIYWYKNKDLWRSYFDPMPGRRRDAFVQFEWLWNPGSTLLLRWHTSCDQNYSSDNNKTDEVNKHVMRFQINKSVTRNILLRSRVEKVYLTYSQSHILNQGINIYQDLRWKVSSHVQLSFRYSSFETSDYETRLYEYENDLPGAFSTYPLYGKGIKWYVILQLAIWQKLTIWIKYRNIRFDGIAKIGSGLSEIMGDKRQDVKLQIQFKY